MAIPIDLHYAFAHNHNVGIGADVDGEGDMVITHDIEYSLGDFGSMVLAVYSVLESYVLGTALVNRKLRDDVRSLQQRHYNALIGYLNNGNEDCKSFLSLCNDHIDDIANGNLDFMRGEV